MVSVICPIYNEEKYITKCIESVLEQDYPTEDLEILFVDGLSTDKTRKIVSDYATRYNQIRLLDNPHRIVPYAMNIGIKAAKGDIIIRLDGHVEYPTNYISKCVHYLMTLPNAENVGGVCQTLPCNERNISQAIAIALSTGFGMGNSSFRIGSTEIRKVDTVPFGCFRKSLFERIGYYDNELVRNQDDELNGRIIKNGGTIYLIPEIKTKYFSRDKICKIRRMFYQYGLYKPLVNKKLGSPATARQFVPLLFLLGIVLGGILSMFSIYIMYTYFAVLALYLAIGLFIGCKYAVKYRRPMLTLLMPYVFANVHLSYGYGYLRGIYKILANKKFNVESNR